MQRFVAWNREEGKPAMVTRTSPFSTSLQFAADVRAGLSRVGQKELPSKYLYDEVGSALFEVITLLPEYWLTRADTRLLKEHAEEIVRRLPGNLQVAELGSGSGKKTRYILEAVSRIHPTFYYPIEISPAALAACERELGQIDMVSILGYEQTYLDGLRSVTGRLREQDHLLVLFLGSTIGNFDREAGDEFLREVRETLRFGDALLLGTDLEKDEEVQLLAYDDPTGVTASFNLNLLARVNRELGANFDLKKFAHEARWNAGERRIEMHLRSLKKQSVSIPKAEMVVAFQEGETIWTESSHKYAAGQIPEMARRTGFHCEAQWVDEQWAFAQNLWLAA
jgi:L-histidine Nalpha-methyltransferase